MMAAMMNMINSTRPTVNSRKRLLFGISALLIAFALTNCQTTQQGGAHTSLSSTGTPGQKSYSIFYDQGDHLAELARAKRWREAADLYAEHQSFFAKNLDNAAILTNLRATAKNMDDKLGVEADRVRAAVDGLQWPGPVERWGDVKSVLAQAADVLENYQSTAIFKVSGFRSTHSGPLKSVLEAKKARIAQDAETAFLAHGTEAGPSFFRRYPVPVDETTILGRAMPALLDRLDGQTVEQLTAFQKQYAAILTPEHRARIADLAFARIVDRRAGGDRAGLKHVLEAFEEAKALGLEPENLESPAIRFVEVTSKTLLTEGQIEFSAAVEIDLPIAFEQAELDAALSATSGDDLDYLIVYDVAVAKTFRRVASREKVASRYKSGVRQEANPARATAQMAVQQAQANLQSVEIRSATGCIGCGLIPALIHAGVMGSQKTTARNQLSAAMQNLANTPVSLEKPVYADYNYNRTYVDAGKVMSVNYYVIDLAERAYFKSFMTINEKREFTIAYQLRDNDPNLAEHRANSQSEEQVKRFEQAAMSVPLSAILGHYLENRGQRKPLPAIAALRREMLKDKNLALTRYAENTFDARPLNDPRFDSVVVVYNPEGKVGSGFFVKPDLVLTNYHVIEGASFIEMKLYDGQETFGKVVKTDIRLDLALVKVQARGKPVRLFTGNTVDLGTSADAIGHPNGLNFSITRGVVSALRKLHSTYAPGGKQILFIQTDAAINPGNSGGPLFLGDRVVGMNTQKLARVEVEGLGFALHYSEIKRFLSDNFGS